MSREYQSAKYDVGSALKRTRGVFQCFTFSYAALQQACAPYYVRGAKAQDDHFVDYRSADSRLARDQTVDDDDTPTATLLEARTFGEDIVLNHPPRYLL